MQNSQYFRNLSNDQLSHAIRDISKAISVAATWDDGESGQNKYLDQYHAAIGEENRRTERNVCRGCKRPL